MAKPYTRVEIVCHFGNKGIQLTGSALNRIRLESLKKAGSNWDDADVLFNIKDYPVWENNPPEGTDRMVWVMSNIDGMLMFRDSMFRSGIDPHIAKMSENELCNLIKKHNPDFTNEQAFDLAEKLRTRKFVPATHILWVWENSDDAPDYIKAFMYMHNSHCKDFAKSNADKRATMVCLDECKENYKPEDYLHGLATVQHMDSEGKVGTFL